MTSQRTGASILILLVLSILVTALLAGVLGSAAALLAFGALLALIVDVGRP